MADNWVVRKTSGIVAALVFLTGGQAMAINIDAMWDYGKPLESEVRFREAQKTLSGDDVLELETQIARTYSIRNENSKSIAILDAIGVRLNARTGATLRVRWILERGRTLAMANDFASAKPLFQQAFDLAQKEGLTLLAIDAAHMFGFSKDLDEAMRWNERAMALAMSTNVPRALRWRGSLANNMGVSERERGNLDVAMKHFRASLTAFQLTRRDSQIRVAQWQVANVLRLQKKYDEALAMQLRLEKDMTEANVPDGYVYEEIAEIYWAKGSTVEAKPYFAKAVSVLGADSSFVDSEKARLARLIEMAK